MLNTLSGRFLMLTVAFVMLAEVFIFVPSIARFREDFLMARLERAQIASLAVLASPDMIDEAVEAELLLNAGVYNVILRRDEMSQLVLSSPVPKEVKAVYDLRDASAFTLIRDAMECLLTQEDWIIRVIGTPLRDAGEQIEVTMNTGPLRSAMIDYGLNILLLSAVISGITASLLFFAVQRLLVGPIRGVVGAMQTYASAPEDARRIITPTSRVSELREAEEALNAMETELTSALRQKERLAQVGGAVAKISHDLRNILTSAQLFADRIEGSDDPLVARVAPKMVNSIGRAVNLCESTLAFGKAEEPAPRLSQVALCELVDDVLDGERLAVNDSKVQLLADIPVGLSLRADVEQIHRVLSNLTRNARQAIEASGKEGAVTISAGEDDTSWMITVSDTGPGLPPKARENLFTPFQGGVRKGGSGLGLAISAELVRGHGGRLELLHSDEAGTRFQITLPKGLDVI